MFFSPAPAVALIPSVGPSSNTRKLFFDNLYEMMKYYQQQKL